MGRQRKLPANVVQLDFFGMVDYVTLGTKPHYIEQYDGSWPPYAEVIASRVISRQPRPLGRRGEHRPEFISDRFVEHRFQKWCSSCGEWIDRLEFSEDRSRRDGLHDWCKACRNRHARRMYWLQKQETKLVA